LFLFIRADASILAIDLFSAVVFILCSLLWCAQVIASDVVLNRLTLHQSPPLNNTTHGGSGGNVDGLPRPPSSSSATCAGQEPPPGGVQSLAELEVRGRGGGCTSIGKGDEEMHARMLEVHAHALELNEYSTYAVTNFILDLWDF